MGVDNGANARLLALQARVVEPEDDAITVSNTAAPTIVAIRQIEARPPFVDINPHAYRMDTTRLEDAITPHTRFRSPK